jgi:hypothetical protein
MTIDTAIAPAGPEQAEYEALTSLIAEFDDAADARKIDYLKHRYAGFNRKESATLAGVKLPTSNKWLKEDPRVARFDELVSTGKRRELRKDVLQEEWFRNFALVMKRDAYILKKVHGLLEERVLDIDIHGARAWRTGSPMMTKSDWDEYTHMRKMYTPDAWASIEKAISGKGIEFNIAEFVLNMPNNQQINIQGD